MSRIHWPQQCGTHMVREDAWCGENPGVCSTSSTVFMWLGDPERVT